MSASPWPVLLHTASAALLLAWVLFAVTRSARRAWLSHHGGHIRLDSTEPTERQVSKRDVLYAHLLDNLSTDLLTDGEAVNEAQFWRAIRLQKVAILLASLALTAILGFETVDSIQHRSTPGELFTITAEAVTSTWMLLCAVLLTSAKKPDTYARFLHSHFSASALLVLHLYLETISPYLADGLPTGCQQSRYVSSGIACAVTLLSGTVQQEPDRYRERERLYNQAVAKKLSEIGGEPIEANVIGTGTSIMGRFFSTHMFHIVGGIVVKDQVDLHELPVLSGTMQAEPTTLTALETEKGQVEAPVSRWRFFISIWRPQRSASTVFMICIIVERVLAYLPFYCLKQILQVLDGQGFRSTAWSYASLYIVVRKMENFTAVRRLWDTGMFHINRGFETHLNILLFRKLLTRNVYSGNSEGDESSGKKTTVPDIMNLISSDFEQLADMVWTLGSLMELVLSAAVGCAFIWSLLGVSAFWGILASFAAYPPAYLLARWELRLLEKSRTASDGRVGAIQDTIQTISMIKMMGYELFTFRRLSALRRKEFSYQFRARVVGFASAALYSAAPAAVVVVSFAHYTLVAQRTLTAALAFTSLAVFAELRPTLTLAPKHISDLFKQFLAIKRICQFLQAPDTEFMADADIGTSTNSGPLLINGDISWRPASNDEAAENSTFALRNLDLHFPRGALTLIAGRAGSGKTLLLNALLGEVSLLQGNITYCQSPLVDTAIDVNAQDWTLRPGGVAYVPQTAWLQSMSIRDNILFGLPMNEERYKDVLQTCALLPDLSLLPDADLTEIGERGKTLSGGQKARVSLARAMYSRASILVLDDVISAVDPAISQHIIRQCLLPAAASGRTVVLASHAVESLAPIAQHAVFLEAGTAQWSGTGPELLRTEHMVHLRSAKAGFDGLQSGVGKLLDDGTAAPTRSTSESTLFDPSAPFELKPAEAKTPRQMLVDEKRAHGAVELHFWAELIRLCGGRVYLTVFALMTAGSVLAPVAERGVIRAWTEGTEDPNSASWLALYTLAASSVVVFTVGQEFTAFFGGFHALQKTYLGMLDRVLRAPMLFFVRTRAGSIVQRFSGDLDQVIQCSETLGELLLTLSQAIISLTSVSLLIGWHYAAAVLSCVVLFWKPAMNYRLASRQVRRLISILPGPVNAHFGETHTGAPVIRAFGAQMVHTHQMIRLTNMYQTSLMMAYMIGRWSWVYTEILDLMVLIIALTLILSVPNMTGAQAGFIMGFAQTITTEFNNFLVCMREVDLKGVTLERLSEYRCLDTEAIPPFVDAGAKEVADSEDQTDDPAPGWPAQGALTIHDLHARYGPDQPDILKGVSFTVEGGQRVGIVGPSGCGKSTLAKAIFSFVDVTQGTILIDDRDILSLPLHIARGRLGIIGQDPLLVSGTLRVNLDIDNTHTDAELYEALRLVQLVGTDRAPSEEGDNTAAGTITVERSEAESSSEGTASNINVFENLDYKITNAGDNLSTGQKQLVVLARAFLQRKKVLILDEATASIDSKTDQILTRLVHREFQGSTILIIAHRLRTVMQCDRILVMDKGCVVESGPPSELLEKEDGPFRKMCKAAGEDGFQQLVALAAGTA